MPNLFPGALVVVEAEGAGEVEEEKAAAGAGEDRTAEGPEVVSRLEEVSPVEYLI